MNVLPLSESSMNERDDSVDVFASTNARQSILRHDLLSSTFDLKDNGDISGDWTSIDQTPARPLSGYFMI